jgi:NitT/TauT family transport system permease protein
MPPPVDADLADAPSAIGMAPLTEADAGDGHLSQELAGLDALEQAPHRKRRLGRAVWSAVWPKLAALGIGLFIWQVVVWSGWKPEYVLPGPGAVFTELKDKFADGEMQEAIAITLRRAFVGFALALAIGVVVGSLVARIKVLRVAFGSFITGLQTMPSIAWFPLAILLFQLTEQAILFVVVLGAAPAIANGLIQGADHVPPLLVRAGRVMGAKGFSLYRFVVLPASLPSFVGGLKQGWAFSWRSLMAGELLVIIANKPSIGFQLQVGREFSNADLVLAVMIVILVIGILVDEVVFGTLDRWVRRRWGLIDVADDAGRQAVNRKTSTGIT